MIDVNVISIVIKISTNLRNMMLNKVASVFLVSTIFRSNKWLYTIYDELLRILYLSFSSLLLLKFLEVLDEPKINFFSTNSGVGFFFNLLLSSRFSAFWTTLHCQSFRNEWRSGPVVGLFIRRYPTTGLFTLATWHFQPTSIFR